MSFLPDDYKPLQSSAGGYIKLQPGENKIRCIANLRELSANYTPVSPDDKPTVIRGMIGWSTKIGDDGKPARQPHRLRPGDAIDNPEFDEPAKEFWAMIIYNYALEVAQIWDIPQKSIRDQLVSLGQDDDWGDLRTFPISVTRTGEGLETRYSVTPKPKSEISDEIKEAINAGPINLNELYDNGDPFTLSSGDDSVVPF